MFCGTVYVLAGGRIVADGPPRAVLTPATIRAAYGADVLVIEHPDTGTPHLIPRRTQPEADKAITHPGRTPVPARHRRATQLRPARCLVAPSAALLAASLLAACASTSPTASSAASAKPTAGYPVTVTSCGVPVTYDRAPTRAVSNDINTTEDMLALGLESRMVGDFGAVGDGPVGQPIPPEFQAGFAKVRDVSPQNYFTLEELVGLHPDFLFAGWDYGLQLGTNYTPTYLAKFGIKTLVLTESCVRVRAGATVVNLNDTYQDLRNLGAIFGVPQRAAQRHRRDAGPGGGGAGQGGGPGAHQGVRLRQRRIRAVHRARARHGQRADRPGRGDQHLRLAQAEL